MARRTTLLALFLIFLPMLAFVQGSEVKKEATALEEDGGETLEGIRSALQGYITAFQADDIDGVMAHCGDRHGARRNMARERGYPDGSPCFFC